MQWNQMTIHCKNLVVHSILSVTVHAGDVTKKWFDLYCILTIVVAVVDVRWFLLFESVLFVLVLYWAFVFDICFWYFGYVYGPSMLLLVPHISCQFDDSVKAKPVCFWNKKSKKNKVKIHIGKTYGLWNPYCTGRFPALMLPGLKTNITKPLSKRKRKIQTYLIEKIDQIKNHVQTNTFLTNHGVLKNIETRNQTEHLWTQCIPVFFIKPHSSWSKQSLLFDTWEWCAAAPSAVVGLGNVGTSKWPGGAWGWRWVIGRNQARC